MTPWRVHTTESGTAFITDGVGTTVASVYFDDDAAVAMSLAREAFALLETGAGDDRWREKRDELVALMKSGGRR